MNMNKKAWYSLGLAILPVIKLGLQLWGITIPHFDDLLIAIAGGAGTASLAATGPLIKKDS